MKSFSTRKAIQSNFNCGNSMSNQQLQIGNEHRGFRFRSKKLVHAQRVLNIRFFLKSNAQRLKNGLGKMMDLTIAIAPILMQVYLVSISNAQFKDWPEVFEPSRLVHERLHVIIVFLFCDVCRQFSNQIFYLKYVLRQRKQSEKRYSSMINSKLFDNFFGLVHFVVVFRQKGAKIPEFLELVFLWIISYFVREKYFRDSLLFSGLQLILCTTFMGYKIMWTRVDFELKLFTPILFMITSLLSLISTIITLTIDLIINEISAEKDYKNFKLTIGSYLKSIISSFSLKKLNFVNALQEKIKIKVISWLKSNQKFLDINDYKVKHADLTLPKSSKLPDQTVEANNYRREEPDAKSTKSSPDSYEFERLSEKDCSESTVGSCVHPSAEVFQQILDKYEEKHQVRLNVDIQESNRKMAQVQLEMLDLNKQMKILSQSINSMKLANKNLADKNTSLTKDLNKSRSQNHKLELELISEIKQKENLRKIVDKNASDIINLKIITNNLDNSIQLKNSSIQDLKDKVGILEKDFVSSDKNENFENKNSINNQQYEKHEQLIKIQAKEIEYLKQAQSDQNNRSQIMNKEIEHLTYKINAQSDNIDKMLKNLIKQKEKSCGVNNNSTFTLPSYINNKEIRQTHSSNNCQNLFGNYKNADNLNLGYRTPSIENKLTKESSREDKFRSQNESPTITTFPSFYMSHLMKVDSFDDVLASFDFEL